MKYYIKATESNDDLQIALDYINHYRWREFGDDEPEITKADDLSDIGIMFTTTEETDDYYKTLQVNINLIDPSISYYVDDTIVGIEKFKDLKDLIDHELAYELDFNDYYGACMEYGRNAGLLEDNAVPFGPDAKW